MARKNKREDILRAAMNVFCYYGYDGATLDKIAGEAGVSKALVIKYYGTLREMVVICLHRFLDELLEKITRNAAKKGNTYVEHIGYVFELFKLSRPQMRLLLSLFLTPAHEEIAKQLLPTYVQLLQNLVHQFPDTEKLVPYKELNYTMYALLVAYIIGGNEDNYAHAKQQTLGFFLNDIQSSDQADGN